MVNSGRRQTIYLLGAIAVLFVLNLYFVNKTQEPIADDPLQAYNQPKGGNGENFVDKKHGQHGHLRQIRCSADGKPLTCMKDDEDVYFPFSLIKKRFDVSGHDIDENNFEWTTSYARVKIPEFKTYTYASEFGHFASYSVETRDRVRCINPATGIPMSTQWDSTPYYYPIQIAQFGLQHYSRMLAANESTLRLVELGKEHRDWQGSASTVHESSVRTYFKDDETGVEYVNVSAGAQLTNAGVYVYLKNEPDLHVVHFRWRPAENASFTFLVKVLETGSLILLNYVQVEDTRCVWADKVAAGKDQISFTYALGDSSNEWTNVTRDLLVDAARAMTTLGAGKKTDNVIYHPGDLKYVSVGFRGEATLLQRIYQKPQAHRELFLTAADWAVQIQDSKGGWSIPVERSIAERKLVLPPGWYSAMAQGHMLSLLTRAWTVTKNEIYLQSAVKGMELFQKLANDGGVRNDFLENMHWYEEYPTTPGSFVLNGFLYSLIGLYDLSNVETSKEFNKTVDEGINVANQLFINGTRSLLTLLPLFDTGSGSLYDLRHVGLGSAPNLARWDYHAVHVYLIEWLHIITGEQLLADTAQRWAAYARGNRAKHN
ncbi:unnamed protein product, partial [Mesorhabditis belari]|uniref:heparosan-N-sulfate-glucuronate 5-epimerase n=1 Tax=Mesorhabditis belari TaxID=2138241 RepID=A0AAF3E9R6_9BILA